jgi:hypothetical protein
MSQYNNGIRSFTANGALTQYQRVKQSAGSTTTPPQVEAAGAGEQHIGYVEYDAADGSVVSINLINNSGTKQAIAAGAITQGAVIYGAAAGTVDDASSGSAIGIALEAATAANDVIEIVDFSVKSTTAGNVSIADAGSFTATATVEAALQEIYQDLLSTQAFLSIPIATVLEGDASNVVGYLGPGTDPVLDMLNGDTDSALGITWATSDSTPILIQTPLPPDLDTSGDVVLHFRGIMSGSSDTPTIAADSYFNEGDTKIEDVSAAMGAAYAEKTITIAAADVPAGAQTLTIELTPGAHTSDTLTITAFWIEYTRSIRTA